MGEGLSPSGVASVQRSMTELVRKWWATGLLSGVRQSQMQYVAERLENAFRRIVSNDRSNFDRELAALETAGYFR